MKHRLFIGLPLPPTQQTLVSAVKKSLDQLKVPLVWEPFEKIHLTLNFLGNIEADISHDLLRRLPKVLHHFGAINLKLTFLETLYQRHEPSLIYLSPTGDLDKLDHLRQALIATLADLKLSQPFRFLPHFTLAKLAKSDPLTTKKWLDQLSNYEFPPGENFLVEQVVIYESLLSKSGSTYRRIASFALE